MICDAFDASMYRGLWDKSSVQSHPLRARRRRVHLRIRNAADLYASHSKPRSVSAAFGDDQEMFADQKCIGAGDQEGERYRAVADTAFDDKQAIVRYQFREPSEV